MASSGPSLVLTDAQWYPEIHFQKAARRVDAGEGVSRSKRDGATGFNLDADVAQQLDDLSKCDAAVAFFVGTDTDVKTVAPIARRCAKAVFLLSPAADPSARTALETEGFKPTAPGHALDSADLALVTNDWTPERRAFIRDCRGRGVPTVCLQEATNVDFDGPPHRMQWADVPFAQGPHALQYLDRGLYFLTGNPRFDSLRPVPFPEKPLVLINCNFIFGLSPVEGGRAWLDQVLEAVTALDLPYRITVHPRDDSDLAGLDHVMASGAYKVGDQLGECTILVSRDSSLPYEALMLNRHAIYFDPFHEKERCLREDDTGFIKKCSSSGELRAALEKCLTAPPPAERSEIRQACQFLFTGRDGQADLRVARALHAIAANPKLYRTDDARAASALSIATDALLHARLRPALRRIKPLRSIWRVAKGIKLRVLGR